MHNKHHVFGLAADPDHVRRTMAALSAIGIPSERVSVLAADRRTSGELAGELHAHAAHGAFSGGNIGGGLGWLAGLGTLAIPGIGLFVAAGPILGFLTGIAVGRSVGNLNGAMIEEMGIRDTSVAPYAEAIKSGRIIVSVECESATLGPRVVEAMREAGLQDIDSTPEEAQPAEVPPAGDTSAPR